MKDPSALAQAEEPAATELLATYRARVPSPPGWRLVLALALPVLAQQGLVFLVNQSDRFLAGHLRVVTPQEHTHLLGQLIGAGGSAAHACAGADTVSRVVSEIVEPTLAGARAEGFPFRGVFFVGLMLTREGPRVLEYNVRFGDPETQAILARLQTDLAEIFERVARGTLADLRVKWVDGSSACVVLASRGYPGKYETGASIAGLDLAHDHVEVFHAGTSRTASGKWLTAGGRVLGVTATGTSLDAALDRCYHAVTDIHWEGMQYRRDIGKPAQ